MAKQHDSWHDCFKKSHSIPCDLLNWFGPGAIQLFHQPVTADLQQLLRETSRSFYLTVRILPASVRSSIGVAYLLARATDTVADSEWVPIDQRLGALAALRSRILGEKKDAAPLDWSHLVRAQSASAPEGERRLLERIESVLAVLAALPQEEELALIRQVLTTITSGQELDLRRFGSTVDGRISALETADDLNDYTYRVAGCVGEFWTRLTRLRCFPRATLNDASLLEDGIRFGRGLQLVNILRDLPRDLVSGRCYLPRTELTAVGLAPRDLLDAGRWPQLEPVYRRWLAVASSHLEAGWSYTNRLPRGQVRLRLGCAWPVLLGVRTLGKLDVVNPLDASRRVKVSRAEVRQTLLGSLWRLPFRGPWERQFQLASTTKHAST